MNDVNGIAAELASAFSLLETALKVQRATRLWVEVDQGTFPAVFDRLVKSMGFSILCTITGLDLGADLGFIYHLARDGGVMVNVKTRCPKTGSIGTVTPYFPGAILYERELIDLLGAKVDGIPEGRRYPLPDDWPEDQHPLLKTWTAPSAEQGPAAQEAAAKGGETNE